MDIKIITLDNMPPDMILMFTPPPRKILDFLNKLSLEDLNKDIIIAKWMATHNRTCLIKGVKP